MNILVPDSWLRQYLDTKATPKQLKDCLSLCGPSIERINKVENDYVYDIEITSNRVDMASVYGIAREAAAILPRFNLPAALKEFKTRDIEKPQKEIPIEIIDAEKICNRVLGVVLEIDGVSKSSEEMKTRIEKSGVRSLNNLVDITNYIMLEIGHPCHVFDYDRIKTHKLILRFAKKNEPIVTLDDKKYLLNEEDVVIDDGTGKVIDLPGIMGTENSVVNENTKRILFFIESNNPSLIRKTSMRYGIRTMAATINEKHPDPELAKQALLYGVELYQKLAGGKILSNLIDIYPHKEKINALTTDREFIVKRLGIDLSNQDIIEILKSLNFKVAENKSLLEITPPSYRQFDIQIPEDIVEEVARIYGYHNLPNNLMTGHIPVTKKPVDLPVEEKAKTILKYLGLTETYSYSMLSEDLLKKSGMGTNEILKISNPLTEELVFMRKSLIPQMLNNLALNQKLQNQISFFELSKTYLPRTDDLPLEENYLCIGLLNSDFQKLKGILEVLFEELEIFDLSIKPSQKNQLFNNGQAAEIKSDNTSLGYIGNINNHILNNFGITKNVCLLEINFRRAIEYVSKTKIFKSIPNYPPITQDLALTLKSKTYIEDVINAIKTINPLVKEAYLYDSYEDRKTIRVVYQDYQKTLTEEEIRPIREKILQTLEEKFGAKLKMTKD